MLGRFPARALFYMLIRSGLVWNWRLMFRIGILWIFLRRNQVFSAAFAILKWNYDICYYYFRGYILINENVTCQQKLIHCSVSFPLPISSLRVVQNPASAHLMFFKQHLMLSKDERSNEQFNYLSARRWSMVAAWHNFRHLYLVGLFWLAWHSLIGWDKNMSVTHVLPY